MLVWDHNSHGCLQKLNGMERGILGLKEGKNRLCLIKFNISAAFCGQNLRGEFSFENKVRSVRNDEAGGSKPAHSVLFTFLRLAWLGRDVDRYMYERPDTLVISAAGDQSIAWTVGLALDQSRRRSQLWYIYESFMHFNSGTGMYLSLIS